METSPFSFCVTSPQVTHKVASALLSVLDDIAGPRPLVAVCVGSDRATGDSLGPLVGSMLLWGGFPGKVLGTLEKPVHAANLEQTLSCLNPQNQTILGVDACLGTKSEVGSIIVKQGSLKPGLGVKKSLPPVGDLHVAGVVNVGGFMEHLVLQNTRLNLVVKLARAISASILYAGLELHGNKKAEEPGHILEKTILWDPRIGELHRQLPQVFVRKP